MRKVELDFFKKRLQVTEEDKQRTETVCREMICEESADGEMLKDYARMEVEKIKDTKITTPQMEVIY